MSKLFTEEPNMPEMLERIRNTGGLFYQYRPCRRDESTIYDIENIRHGVVYAQTPLNMNDPFDSMIGFSAEKIYENCVDLIIECLNMPPNTQMVVSIILRYQLLGKIGELLAVLKDLKRQTYSIRASLHQRHIPIDRFIITKSSLIYSKLSKNLRREISKSQFNALAIIVARLKNTEISESSINAIFHLDKLLRELKDKATEVRDTHYSNELKKILSQLTISCFTSSGWNNQLMWSHYANSYSGICVEYDFTKIKDFVGFIYPVVYSAERPTISLQDLGMKGFDLSAEEKIIRGDINMAAIFSYLLTKNECWNYEKEWRIINIGEAYVPKFIMLPYIKSITFGINVDPLCRRLLLDVCKDNSIDCFDLLLDKAEYKLHRSPINADTVVCDPDKEIEYLHFIFEQIALEVRRVENYSNRANLLITEGKIDVNMLNMISEILDCISNAYFFKGAFNRVLDNVEDCNKLLFSDETVKGIQGIEYFVQKSTKFSCAVLAALPNLRLKLRITYKLYADIAKKLTDIKEIAQKYIANQWSPKLGDMFASDTEGI